MSNLTAHHHPWIEPPRNVLSENGLVLTNRRLSREGTPFIPVSGEMHYSRVPRERWAGRLRQIRAGGLTVVSSYVFWLHHAEQPGEPRFDGNLDLGAFAGLVAEAGLDLVLRIGPWCHGEARNGGFPDWVQHAPVRHRTDDPAYLDLVRPWFAQIAAALGGRTLFGIQLENELYDQPGHLVTLKRLAREAGLTAPLWLATGWGSAELPAGEVWPLYGGYGDGFWVDADAPWDPTFRDHYFFSHTWDDPGIGADMRGPRPAGLLAEQFPPATCELGGGMATAYHRRPRPSALDVATPAHCKIGNGSAWQGYYMYAGGTNPPGSASAGGLQESHATGYPNDLPRLGYDFHAPIGEAGVLAPSHAELRCSVSVNSEPGPPTKYAPSSLPDILPADVEDDTTLRWALRSDGHSGFLFVAWHQPHVELPAYRGARFAALGLELPSRPIDIPPGTLARWPLRLTVGGVTLDWATASALTVLPGEVPTLVLTAEAGIGVEVAAGATTFEVPPGRTPVRVGDGLDLLVLDPADAAKAWVCEDGVRRLLLSADELSWGTDGRVLARGIAPAAEVYDPATRSLAELPLDGPATGREQPVTAELVRPPGTVPVNYGKHDGRQSAPPAETFDELAAVYRLPVPPGDLLTIDWAGDVAELRVDGRAVTDRFWDGSRWFADLADAGVDAVVTLHVLPLATGSRVSLPVDARSRLLAADGQLMAVDAVRVATRPTWQEAR